jgi:hypothetical protein
VEVWRVPDPRPVWLSFDADKSEGVVLLDPDLLSKLGALVRILVVDHRLELIHAGGSISQRVGEIEAKISGGDK